VSRQAGERRGAVFLEYFLWEAALAVVGGVMLEEGSCSSRNLSALYLFI
jgi:hypothetical protein